MPETPRYPHLLEIDPHAVTRLARRREKHSNPFREAHSGEGCRTLFPELLLAGVSDDGLERLGRRAAARADEAPTIAVWLHGVIAKELSRRVDVPLRALPLVAMPLIPISEIGPTAQVLGNCFSSSTPGRGRARRELQKSRTCLPRYRPWPTKGRPSHGGSSGSATGRKSA